MLAGFRLKLVQHRDGIEFTKRADPASTGPASFIIADPDGNPIFFDQHVPAPAKTK